jgi:ferrous iron transport protein B
VRPGCEDRGGRECRKNRHRKRKRLRQRRLQTYNKLESNFGSSSILLVGNLKVGKSTIFSGYVGRRQHVFNYPNTAVELSVGQLRWPASKFDRIIDAPGFYSLEEPSEDAFVVRDILSRGLVGGALLVLDAKNLRMGLTLAFQLAEYDIPLIIALNMTDEAVQRGLLVDTDKLAQLLGVKIVSVVAIEKRGFGQLSQATQDVDQLKIQTQLPDEIKRVIDDLTASLADKVPAPGGLAQSLVTGIRGSQEALADLTDPATQQEINEMLDEFESNSQTQWDIVLANARQTQIEEITSVVLSTRPRRQTTWLDKIGVWTRRPLTGFPIAIVVLFLIYLFVGWFGAEFLVGLLEGKLFGKVIIPAISDVVDYIPWEWVRQMLVGPFGLITVGITLSLAIVLPVLATFFFAFALLEDSGYLPRLSLLMDRSLRRIGLNGKGVMPLIMGFSCVTMAILTTRMLSTNKQRTIATLLLVLTIPCAPLLSVMMVMLGRLSIWATVVLFGVLLMQLVIVGILANWLIPGERPDFVLELPPIRVPRLRNSLVKSGTQLLWFLREAIPYFILGTFFLFLLDQAGLIEGLRAAFQPVSEHILGLPSESADVFLMTIIRREAGAALLAQQSAAGIYNGVQSVVTLVVMSLMIPCINSVLVMFKERGFWVSMAILIFVVVYSLVVGGLLNSICVLTGAAF